MKRIALIVAIALSTSLVGNLSVQASEVNLNKKDAVIIEKKDDDSKNSNEDIAKKEYFKNLENNQYDINKEEIDINKDKSLYDKFEIESLNNGTMMFAVQNVTNKDIISDTKVTQKIAKEWAKSKGATDEFIELASLYWKYAKEHGGVNPAVAYAQSAKETGYGKFGGVIDATYHNPCGLKTRQGGEDNDPNAHFRFENWDQGVQAHLDHLALYAGANGYPKKDTYDPRHFDSICGKAKTVEELGGAWAPSASYGLEILNLYDEMLDKTNEIKDGWVQENNNWCYYENKKKVTGLKDIDGYTYYFDKDGVRQSGFIDINKNRYYFNEDGKMHKGWKDIGDKSYYLDVNTGEMATGLRVLGGKIFYFTNDGVMSKGFTQIEGKTYYFNDLGRMHKGWLDIEDKSYYLDVNTGEMATGLRVLGGKTFYFTNDGVMSKGIVEIKGENYYFNGLGRMETGWITVGNNKYYFNESGKMHKGWKDIGDKSYYLDVNTGEMATGFKVLGGKTFYFTNDGLMSKGFVDIEGSTYYFNELGRMEFGWLTLGVEKYYFNEDGKMQKGWSNIDNDKYYFNEDGRMHRGWKDIGSKSYYLDINTGIMATGFRELGGQTFYFTNDGIMSKGWTQVKENKYYFNDFGRMQKGWQKIEGKEYYFYPESGIMAKSTTIDGREIDENGVAKDLTKKLIVVDPGHNYGGDYGAESTIDGVTYKETELDMFIAVKLKNELEKQGYNVILTRQIFERPMDDLSTSIAKRVDLANNINADAFISIHHDSSTSIMAKGTTSFYSSWKSGLDNTDIVPGKDPNGYDWYDLSVDLTPTKEALVGKDLAKTIVDNLSADVNYLNRKDHDRNLGVVKRTNMPSVLVECGFITNPEEAKKAADPNNQQKIAESIAKSVKQVIG
ncbi:N-acetylmuramoyl-L-alanine amidase [Clostridium sp.]|uniref:N-acetylmuramoyl-L-alanine amidase n=1 Tax=Clostridium sp. TaxID=1506 RepID=UPI00262D6100